MPAATRRCRKLVVVLFASAACAQGHSQDSRANGSGRLTARPSGAAPPVVAGVTALGLGQGRDGLLYVPKGLAGRRSVALVVLFHGAGGAAQTLLNRLTSAIDSVGFAVLVPDSRGPTWDAIRGEYGPDVAFLDSALRVVFGRVPVDPRRVIASGFSDGASYALGLARINGDLFSHVVAFSPGFVTHGRATGRPPVFITHGNADPVLPYEATSRRIVAALTGSGYAVTFRSFSGGHTVPADLAVEGFRWAVSDSMRSR